MPVDRICNVCNLHPATKRQAKCDSCRSALQRKNSYIEGTPEQLTCTLNQLCSDARRRAKKKGIPYALGIPILRMKYILQEGLCAVTKIPLKLRSHREGIAHPHAISLDRIDNTKGYTPENTRLVTWQYNSAKGIWSDEALLEFATLLVGISK